jgi:glycogen operon protein
MRRFWKGEGSGVAEFAMRLTGSSDLYGDDGRKPYNSVNFITCHDGFTLQDLVSYNEKHNQANGEENRDGANDNNSWNCGVEGDTDDPSIVELREKQKRNLIATLMLSQGVPMILGGDEISHSQKGNNNTYCQDNELTWLNWELDERRERFLAFVKKVIRIWRTQPVFQRRKFFKGRALRGSDIKDISFFTPSGQEMSDADWDAGFARSMGVRLAGDLIDDQDERGEPIVGETLITLFNAHWEPIEFMLPTTREGQLWERLLDTANDEGESLTLQGGESYPLKDRSLAILRTRPVHVAPSELSGLPAETLLRETQPPGPGRPPLD